MKTPILLVAFVALLAGGCASTQTVKEAKGEGASRVYHHGYNAVYRATLAAAKAKELEVAENDRKARRLILTQGVSWKGLGEKVEVFFTPVTHASTKVEVVSKPVLAPLNFQPDWRQALLDQIDAELKAKQ
ncbi:MAG TPA: hypothetical protein VLX30_12830 [Burkholderiales bacterium]|nr:hypothetical protein [Burkholderiales bacterium]